MTSSGGKLKAAFMLYSSEMFEVLTFGELKEGDRFIALPLPGDNRGHGGFRGSYYIFQKLNRCSCSGSENCVRLIDGTLCRDLDPMLVLKVE